MHLLFLSRGGDVMMQVWLPADMYYGQMHDMY